MIFAFELYRSIFKTRWLHLPYTPVHENCRACAAPTRALKWLCLRMPHCRAHARSLFAEVGTWSNFVAFVVVDIVSKFMGTIVPMWRGYWELMKQYSFTRGTVRANLEDHRGFICRARGKRAESNAPLGTSMCLRAGESAAFHVAGLRGVRAPAAAVNFRQGPRRHA